MRVDVKHHLTGRAICPLLVLIAVMAGENSTWAGPGEVLGHRKISSTQGNFHGQLSDSDFFGGRVAPLGDLDGDGVPDLVANARGDDDGGVDRGALWILFLNSGGTVKSHQKISDTEGNFTGGLDNSDWFGWSMGALGDLDGDGVGDLAVGAVLDDDGGTDRGAVWVLFLNSDGTVKSHQKISDTEGNFTGTLDDQDRFGSAVTSVGDLDGDGVDELVVGAYFDDDGGGGRGAVWVLFLNTNGTVKSHQKISDTEGGFIGVLDGLDQFGFGAAALGDLDGDGVDDLAVGTNGDDDGGANVGALWVLFLNSDGTVKSHQKISDTAGGFTGEIDNGDRFGQVLGLLGDVDGDGVVDLAAVASDDDDGGTNHGAVWVLFLNTNGTVKAHQKISDTAGNFLGDLDAFDRFGSGVAALGDVDGDGVTELAVGAAGDDDGGTDRGAVWLLFLDGAPPAPGSVANGDDVPGVPLSVDKTGGIEITLTWDASCVSNDSDYEIYEGTVGDFTSHFPRLCSTGGQTTETLIPLGGNTYYLVVPRSIDLEGSYGTDSDDVERPPGDISCLPQSIGECSP